LWNIEYSYIEPWLDAQDEETIANIFAALEVLEREGPTLGRPLVDSVKGSRIRHLKELRPVSSGRAEVRILFAFDPKRHAIMLYAGDKSLGKNNKAKWSHWYRNAIRAAEELYDRHLKLLGDDA